MSKTKALNRTIQDVLLQLFGGAGYIAWVLQLLLLVALYFERFYHSGLGKVVFPTSNGGTNLPPETITTPSVSLPTSGLFTFFVLVLGIAFIGFVAYIVTMRYVPAVNKTAAKVVREVAEQTVKQVEKAGHRKIPVQKRRVFTARIVMWLKLIISVAPVIIVLFVAGTSLISKQVAILGMAALSLFAVLCFTVQIILVRFWRKTTNTDAL